MYKRSWLNRDGSTSTVWAQEYRDPLTGRKRKIQRTRKADLAAALADLAAAHAAQADASPAELTSIGAVLDSWLAACEAGRDGREPVEASTLRQYEHQVRLHLKKLPLALEEAAPPVLLADLTLARLDDPMLHRIRAALLQACPRPLAGKCLTSLKSALREAQSAGMKPPTIGATFQIVTSSRHRAPPEIPTRREMAAILAAAERRATEQKGPQGRGCRRFRAFLVLMQTSGLRPSELRGLSRAALDLKGALVKVTQRADETGQIGSPKSRAGRRQVHLPPGCVTVLREWLVECPKSELGLIFPTFAEDEKGAPTGAVWSLANITNRHWGPTLVAAGVTTRQRGPDGQQRTVAKYSLYAVRHFHASALIAAGASPKEVQEEMGHSSIKVTFDTYGHLFPEDDSARRRRAAAMETDLRRHQKATKTPETRRKRRAG